jgi:hypothetical protein
VEAVDRAAVGEAFLMAPVDLGLRSGSHREAAVHLTAGPQAELGGDLGAAMRGVLLDALVGARVAVLADQAFVDRGGADLRLRGAQSGVDGLDVGIDELLARWPRLVARRLRAFLREVLAGGAPVAAREAGDLGPGRAGRGQ